MTTATFTLPDSPVTGTPTGDVELRALNAGDAAAVRAVFAGMGHRSRELRFLSPKPRLTERDVRRLVAVDGSDHVAVLAVTVDDPRPVGIARLIRDRELPEAAEVAVEVVDAWQQRGVGTLLLTALLRRTVEIDVRRLSLFTSHDNVAVVRLLGQAPGAVSRVSIERGAIEYAVSLDEAL